MRKFGKCKEQVTVHVATLHYWGFNPWQTTSRYFSCSTEETNRRSMVISMFEEHPNFYGIFIKHPITGLQFCRGPIHFLEYLLDFSDSHLGIIVIIILGRDGNEQWTPASVYNIPGKYPSDHKFLMPLPNTENWIEMQNLWSNKRLIGRRWTSNYAFGHVPKHPQTSCSTSSVSRIVLIDNAIN